MPAYVIAQLTVTDPEGFEAYRQAAPPVIEAYGGRCLVRGSTTSPLEGDHDKPRVIVLEFPDKAAAERFYNSPEYQEILPLRRNTATGSVVVVEGGV
ncbi:MAG: DUF1330 domain-containing protein [Kiloniellaceae bacterium]